MREENFYEKQNPITVNLRVDERAHVLETERFMQEVLLNEEEPQVDREIGQNDKSEEFTLVEYKCKRCNKSFKTNKKLKRHLNDSHSGKLFECKYENCHQKYKSKNALSQHYSKSHRE